MAKETFLGGIILYLTVQMDLDLKNLFSTHQWIRLAILIVSAVLSLAGISLIIYGFILGLREPSDILQEKMEDPGALVYVGVLHLAAGVSGTVAALLRLTALLFFVSPYSLMT